MKKISCGILAVFLLFIICVPVSAAESLIPGGQVIGLSLADGSLTVISIDENLGQAAKAAGLQAGDRLTKINNTEVHSISQVRSAIKNCTGQVTLQVLRKGKSHDLQLSPTPTSEGPKLGIYLKEGVTGIGTVTYYDPATGTYGALGHGVNQPNGSLLTMESGHAYNAAILSVNKGQEGKPGQLLGTLTGQEPCGTIDKNTNRGIFGNLAATDTDPLPLGQAKEGAATIRSTVSQNGIQEYSVEILKIYPNAKDNGRNMLLHVTDPRLLETTGGIVQGMSGSPIIQNGCLVGAVTHVLVNDPTTGYGIFIDNMLAAA